MYYNIALRQVIGERQLHRSIGTEPITDRQKEIYARWVTDRQINGQKG